MALPHDLFTASCELRACYVQIGCHPPRQIFQSFSLPQYRANRSRTPGGGTRSTYLTEHCNWRKKTTAGSKGNSGC